MIAVKTVDTFKIKYRFLNFEMNNTLRENLTCDMFVVPWDVEAQYQVIQMLHRGIGKTKKKAIKQAAVEYKKNQ